MSSLSSFKGKTQITLNQRWTESTTEVDETAGGFSAAPRFRVDVRSVFCEKSVSIFDHDSFHRRNSPSAEDDGTFPVISAKETILINWS